MTREELFDRRKEMAEAVKAGKSPPEVARDYRVSIQTIMRACMEQGVNTKQKSVQPSAA